MSALTPAFVGACVLLALTPGPDMAFYVARTLSGGRRLGFAALAGVMAGLLAHALAAALGLSALLAASAGAYRIVKWVGAAYLAWLAIDVLRHGSALRLAGGVPRGPGATFLSGLGINLTNPKIILFFVTFLPQFVAAGDPAAPMKFLTLGLIFLVVGSLVSALVVLVAGRFVALMKAKPRALRIFDFVTAGVLGSFAVRLATSPGR